jgi:hypothetical protein
MRNFTHERFRQQVCFLQRQFLQDGDLPFSNTLSKETIAEVLRAINVCWLDRIYTPLITLWVFLNQVLSQDHSCRAVVSRLVAHRVSQGQRPYSAETGAYCQARKRLPKKSSSRKWLGGRDGHWIPMSIPNGFVKNAVSISSMDRRSRCPTHRKTNVRIRNPIRRNPASAFRWRGSRPSFLSPVVRCWT